MLSFKLKNRVVLFTAISAFAWCLLVVAAVESAENHPVRLKTSRHHASVLAMDDSASKGMVIGIDARHLLRLIGIDPNIYVIYIGGGTEFESRFGGSIKAVHTSLNQIKANTLKIPDDRTLILICPSGRQSHVAAKIISARGYVVYYLIGGMNGLNQLENHKSMHREEKHLQEQRKKINRPKNDGPQHPKSIFEEDDMGC